MLGNEIDDSSPPRCLVHSSTVVDAFPGVTRKLLMPTVGYTIVPSEVDIAMVNDLSDKGLLMVLFGFETDPVSPEEVLKEIDHYHHPFNEWLVFPDVKSMTTYVSSQSDVRYVIDRQRPWAHGSWQLHI